MPRDGGMFNVAFNLLDVMWSFDSGAGGLESLLVKNLFDFPGCDTFFD
jgi:hypothetical protein